MQATLKTARLHLRPLTEDNFEDMLLLNSDPAVLKYIVGRAMTREEVVEEQKCRLNYAVRVPGLGVWAGYFEDEFVGTWTIGPQRVTDGEPDPKRGELGYRLRSKFWRRGLAKEGAKEVLRHAFEDLKLSLIRGETMAVNAASRATMEACGLEFVRVFHEKFDDPLPGTEQGEAEYCITREQWLAKQTK